MSPLSVREELSLTLLGVHRWEGVEVERGDAVAAAASIWVRTGRRDMIRIRVIYMWLD